MSWFYVKVIIFDGFLDTVTYVLVLAPYKEAAIETVSNTFEHAKRIAVLEQLPSDQPIDNNQYPTKYTLVHQQKD